MARRRVLVPALVLFAFAAAAASPSGAEVVQRGDVRVGFEAELRPRQLPRQGAAPVTVSLEGRIDPIGTTLPPRLRTIQVEINRFGRLDPSALPVCPIASIQPSTTKDALGTCGPSVVGEGSFSAAVLLPEQTPFPSRGRVVAFNGRFDGAPAILAHVYGTKPAPTSFTLPFRIGHSKGTFGTVLSASLPRVATSRAYVTSLEMTLGGGPGGRHRGFVSAGCPAPAGFPSAVFPLARATFEFVGGPTLRSTVVRGCRARG
ncbi:MAG: hypothetical protein JJE35_09615 [Thermoleophilia bacterium]|nr:hypothetical protein [Thermoleophilia bacterium]